MPRRKLLCIFWLLWPPFILLAQDSLVNKKRLNLVGYGSLATYSVGMIGLSQTWYSQSTHQSFHFFNDAKEWKQMDKVGHLFSAFHLSNTGYKMLSWANSKEKKRALFSSLAGFTVLSSIEIFDGFSADYGASLSDVAANATGSLLFYSQIAGWQEIRLFPKFSFSRSGVARLNPDLLGSGLSQEILKDYNGQTYWLSIDMDKFIRFPKWLNLAAGYGADNMKFAHDSQNIAEGFKPMRQFYLSVDFDLTAIHTKSKFLKGVIYFVNMVKLPAPTLELNPNGLKGHWLHF
jgi:Predicted periplasmic lipoprotein (DUF2279)